MFIDAAHGRLYILSMRARSQQFNIRAEPELLKAVSRLRRLGKPDDPVPTAADIVHRAVYEMLEREEKRNEAHA